MIVGFVLSCFVTSAIARADVKDILLQFHPYATVQEEYTNNVNLTPTNKKDDFMTSIFAGVSFSSWLQSAIKGELVKPTPPADKKYGIDLNFRAGYLFYAHETNNNYLDLLGGLNAWYTFTPGLTFRVSEYLVRSESAREEVYPGSSSAQFVSGSFVDLTNLYLPGTQRPRAVYFRNVVSPSIEYKFGKESMISLGYMNNVYINESPTSQNSQENDFVAKFNYWFDIRNGIVLQYGVFVGTFQNSPSLTGQATLGRYIYRFNPRTSIFGEFVFLSDNYQSPGIDYVVYRPSIGIEHAFSPTSKGMIALGYFWQVPQLGKTQSAPYYKVLFSTVVEKTTFAFFAQGGYTVDLFSAQNYGFSLSQQAVGTVTQQLTEKMAASLSGSYQWYKSGILQQSGPIFGSNQTNNLWEITGNTSYQFSKWLGLKLALTYRENHSNIAVQDYAEFRALINGTVSF